MRKDAKWRNKKDLEKARTMTRYIHTPHHTRAHTHTRTQMQTRHTCNTAVAEQIGHHRISLAHAHRPHTYPHAPCSPLQLAAERKKCWELVQELQQLREQLEVFEQQNVEQEEKTNKRNVGERSEGRRKGEGRRM